MSDTSHRPALLEATSRVALAAMLHDIGKFAERARIEVDQERLDAHKNIYCPHWDGRPSHIHAAYSALVLEDLEGDLPELLGDDVAPFASWGQPDVDDSLINAAAKHHRPETFLQWIVATADRAASGLDRESFDEYNQASRKGLNHYTTRQWTLFEQIRIDEETRTDVGQPRWRYPLQGFTPTSIFPVAADECEGRDWAAAQAEYRRLWNEFRQALHCIPLGHSGNLPMWLDHFDTLWMLFAHAIPAATFKTYPDVSLYDHTKAVTALAAALWRYHHEREDDTEAVRQALRNRADWDDSKLLMVQGDLFGIQDFIFAAGGQTERNAARLLRGRSFYVSLLTECAAFHVLEALALPPTSQIMNAAGKFLIVAPNTANSIAALQGVQRELDAWCLEHTYGQVGIGLAWEAACCNDLQIGEGAKSPYRQLISRLFHTLEEAKLRRFDLCGENPCPPVFQAYLDRFGTKGVCAIDGRLPAEEEYRGNFISRLARDHIAIGRALTQQDRYDNLVISAEPLPQSLRLDISLFGYHVGFIDHETFDDHFADRAPSRKVRRCWDILPHPEADVIPWHGKARRYVNSYVPVDPDNAGFKDFEVLARQAHLDAQEDAKKRGVAALMTVKGDIDDLGAIFQNGLASPSFSRIAALSRQINAFFTVYLPWLCQQEFPDTYTVFAGGDDFFLIGPWRQQLMLAEKLRSEFQRYVGGNPDLSFSAGLVMTKPGIPIRYMARRGEEALEAAKEHQYKSDTRTRQRKNAITCFDHTVPWEQFFELMRLAVDLDAHPQFNALSQGYKYGLLELIAMQEKVQRYPQNARWKALFTYRTWRMLERKQHLDHEQRQAWHDALAQILIERGIDRFGANFRIALIPYLYNHREVTAK